MTRTRQATITWTAHCDTHSDADAGVHVFACGTSEPPRSACPCEIGDRFVVVEAVRAGVRWKHCADVLICVPQPELSAALHKARAALAKFPGCTLAVASVRASGSVLCIGEETIMLPGRLPEPALLATFAHLYGR